MVTGRGQCRVILSLLEEKDTGYIPVGIIDDVSELMKRYCQFLFWWI